MASMLKQVLQTFEHHNGPLTLGKMAQELDLEPGILEGMIDYWVRKGKLRVTGGVADSCSTCGVKGGCPFVMAMPRMYELILTERDDRPASPPCSCCHS